MYIYQAPDRAQFLANRPQGTPVRVVRMSSAEVVRRNGRIESVPAVQLTYSFMRGDQEWVFQETRVAKTNPGTIDLSDTLWAQLESAKDDYQLLQRSGSF